jgi:hypothetical protein
MVFEVHPGAGEDLGQVSSANKSQRAWTNL